MSTEEIQQVFLNTDAHYTIDLKNSKLKGEAFVTYIANMQINCSLATVEGTSKEEKFEVLKHYLTFRQTIKCDTLLNTTALMLLKFVGVPVELTCDWMNFDEMREFAELNKEIVLETALFINSAPLFVAAFNNDFRKEVFDKAVENGEIEVIDNPDIVGINAINLFSIPNFTEVFIGAVFENPDNQGLTLRYYKAQVERLQYDRKTVFDIFIGLKENSFLMSFVNLMFNQSEDGAELKLLQSLT